jgi:tripartite ATP-independent transporter DctP family solute receptor
LRRAVGAACRGSPIAAQAQRPVTLRLTYGANDHEPPGLGSARFADDIAKAANSQLNVEVFPNGQLGEEDSVLKSLQTGTIAITNVASSAMANYVAELHLFDLPFLFRDRAHAYSVVDGAVGAAMAQAMEAKGFVLLGFFDLGIRNILNSRRPINDLADFKGMKMRVIPNPINLDTFRALGANPVPVPYNQLYLALQTHLADAADAANTNYLAQRLYEVAPYYAGVEWQVLLGPMVISKRIFDRLTPAQQALIREAARDAVAVERAAYAKADAEAMDALLAKGVKLTHPDRAPWIEAVKPVWDKWAATVGKDTLDLVQQTK